MKNLRHVKILEIIEKHSIDRQDDLLQRLKNEGFEVTQATVSRDIRQLRLIKTTTSDGVFKYTSLAANKTANTSEPSRFETIFSASMISVDGAGNTVMVKCHNGMASAACEVFDLVEWDDVVGTLAGENTFIILMRSDDAASLIIEKIKKYIK